MRDPKRAARLGMNAANTCASSFYVGALGAVLAFVPDISFLRLGMWICAAAAVGTGIAGLLLVAFYRAQTRGYEPERGLEMVAHQRVRRAPEMAGGGMGSPSSSSW